MIQKSAYMFKQAVYLVVVIICLGGDNSRGEGKGITNTSASPNVIMT